MSILLNGAIRAFEIQVRYRTRGVFKWAPKLEAWLRLEGHKFWLGVVLYSLGGCVSPATEVGLRALTRPRSYGDHAIQKV